MIGITVNCQTVNCLSSPLPWRFYGYLVGAGSESFGPRVQQQGGGMRELPNYTLEIKHRYQKLPYLKGVTFSKAHYFGYPNFFFGGVPITFEHAKRRYFCLRPCSSTAIYEQCIDSFSFSLYIEYIHSVK